MAAAGWESKSSTVRAWRAGTVEHETASSAASAARATGNNRLRIGPPPEKPKWRRGARQARDAEPEHHPVRVYPYGTFSNSLCMDWSLTLPRMSVAICRGGSQYLSIISRVHTGVRGLHGT